MAGADLKGTASEVWPRFRQLLDRIHEQAERYVDHRAPLGYAPKVIIALRANDDLDWRVVQECQQILADSIDPRTGLAKEGQRRPFTNLHFAAREP
jgi:hypothetical protein